MRQAVKDSYLPPTPTPDVVLQKQNKDAVVKRIPEHGLLVVQYASGRVDDKQEHRITPRGKSRNNYGGFFNS